MDEQFTFPGFESPEYLEVQFLNSIFPKLKDAIVNHGSDAENISYSVKNDYTVVSFLKLTCFRLRLRGNQPYISVPLTFSDLIPPDFPQKRLQSDPKYIRLLVDDQYPIDAYTEFLSKIAGETINRYPKSWDCCSRYLECSDAKTCTNPDKTFALECGYRKILNSGRIFYGENRNID